MENNNGKRVSKKAEGKKVKRKKKSCWCNWNSVPEDTGESGCRLPAWITPASYVNPAWMDSTTTGGFKQWMRTQMDLTRQSRNKTDGIRWLQASWVTRLDETQISRLTVGWCDWCETTPLGKCLIYTWQYWSLKYVLLHVDSVAFAAMLMQTFKENHAVTELIHMQKLSNLFHP